MKGMRKEHAVEIIRYGYSEQKADPSRLAEANADTTIRAFGNAAIANVLETLGGCGVIQDVLPTLGTGGLGFAYRLSPDCTDRIGSGISISDIVDDAVGGSLNETSAAIGSLLRRCREHPINPVYSDDLLATLSELRTCFANDCYIACLALSGKLLEICLKQLFLSKGLQFEEGWMIGQLLRKLRESDPEKYLDQSLGDIANIINKSRIPAVHSKERVPVPSREQAMMVISAVVDTVNRTLLSL
jgi:HEPN domain-containing protein